ncbi:MAG TPA: ABC transporter substrate-binding protein [Synergistaceae bacterium]|nr:ABC transporter substrate-binding protein [Synergistaceae bacterium]HQH77857.1 ABC transporter substrate-binding protein [Synergistaceae bacterium]
MVRGFRAVFLVMALILAVGGGAWAEDPVKGGTLLWRDPSDVPTLDPAKVTDNSSTRLALTIFETLVENDLEGKGVLPCLAERWEGSDGGKVWTFHLRPGVRFQAQAEGQPTANGGREVRASDVKYSIERLILTDSPRAYFLDMVKGYQDFMSRDVTGVTEWAGVKVIDEKTVQFELDYPFAPFVAMLAYPTFSVVPQEDAEKWGKDFGFHPVGTGAFAFEKWEHDIRISLKKNPDYWRTDARGERLPYMDGVEFVVVPDDAVAYEELKKGNLDVFSYVPDEIYQDAREKFSDTLKESPALAVSYYGFNMAKEPFGSNKALRQAVNYAIDKNKLNELIYENRVVPAVGVLPPGMPGYDVTDMKGYPYDLDKARALMKEAGYEKGLECTLQINNVQRHQRIGEAVQAMLMEVGITMNIVTVDWGTHIDALDRGEVPFFRYSWIADYADPDNFLYVLFHSANAGPKGNNCFYNNAEVDRMLDQARVEVDWNKRAALYHEAEKIIVDDAPWVFFFNPVNELLSVPRVKNIKLPTFGADWAPLYDVWLAQ